MTSSHVQRLRCLLFSNTHTKHCNSLYKRQQYRFLNYSRSRAIVSTSTRHQRVNNILNRDNNNSSNSNFNHHHIHTNFKNVNSNHKRNTNTIANAQSTTILDAAQTERRNTNTATTIAMGNRSRNRMPIHTQSSSFVVAEDDVGSFDTQPMMNPDLFTYSPTVNYPSNHILQQRQRLKQQYLIHLSRQHNHSNRNSKHSLHYRDFDDSDMDNNDSNAGSIAMNDSNDDSNDSNDSNNNDSGSNNDDDGNNNSGDDSSDNSTPTEAKTTPAPTSSESSTESDAYSLTPNEMISELDRFVIGQTAAKRAVAISWRARWRRRRLSEEYKREVTPKNILMVGPTGCGKTEVARRLARLSDSPFVKIEATKFTEVGYVGKDVNTIIEDLVAHAATLVKSRKEKELKSELKAVVDNLLLRSLMGKLKETELAYWKSQLDSGLLNEVSVEIDVQKEPDFSSLFRGAGGGGGRGSSPYLIFSAGGGGGGPGGAGGDGPMGGGKHEKKTLPIKKARSILMDQELKKFLSDTDLAQHAVELTENDGIVFIDEIDKICGSRDSFRGGGGERRVSQEGVQRDLLPLIEGTSVNVQNYGKVNTDHVLFICAGAFHDAKPADLMPEFQGRLPVRVQLQPLTKDDFVRILTVTEYNLIQQQIEMLKTEGCVVQFEDSAINCIADTAVECNTNVENIGARRLVTVIEKIMEDINVEAPEGGEQVYTIDDKYVQEHLGDIFKGEDFDKFIL